MTAYWIGYILIALLLGVIRVVINDGARDHRLAWILVATWIFVLAVLYLCRRCT